MDNTLKTLMLKLNDACLALEDYISDHQDALAEDLQMDIEAMTLRSQEVLDIFEPETFA